SLTESQLVDRLNDLGYADRLRPEKPGEFTMGPGDVTIRPRGANLNGQLVRVIFQRPAPPAKAAANRKPKPPPVPDRVQRLELGPKAIDRVTLDTPVLTSLISGE